MYQRRFVEMAMKSLKMQDEPATRKTKVCIQLKTTKLMLLDGFRNEELTQKVSIASQPDFTNFMNRSAEIRFSTLHS